LNANSQRGTAAPSLHAEIGKLALDNDFLEGALTEAGLLSAKRQSTVSTRQLREARLACRAQPGCVSAGPEPLHVAVDPAGTRRNALERALVPRQDLVDQQFEILGDRLIRHFAPAQLVLRRRVALQRAQVGAGRMLYGGPEGDGPSIGQPRIVRDFVASSRLVYWRRKAMLDAPLCPKV
jgi:hypothetical protein